MGRAPGAATGVDPSRPTRGDSEPTQMVTTRVFTMITWVAAAHRGRIRVVRREVDRPRQERPGQPGPQEPSPGGLPPGVPGPQPVQQQQEQHDRLPPRPADKNRFKNYRNYSRGRPSAEVRHDRPPPRPRRSAGAQRVGEGEMGRENGRARDSERERERERETVGDREREIDFEKRSESDSEPEWR